MKIAVVLPDLRGGGVERMRVQLAGVWLTRGFDVDFVLLQKKGELLAILPEGVEVIDLGVDRLRSAIGPLKKYYKNNRPAVVLAAMWPLTVMSILALRMSALKVRMVVSDHDQLSVAYKNKGFFHHIVMKLSMGLIYRMANARIGVSKGVVKELSHLSGISREKFQVIYNPAATGNKVTLPLVRPLELTAIEGQLILAVGSLKDQKDFVTLINAFSEIVPHVDATLCILGEGKLRGILERLVKKLGLEDSVLLPGFQVNTVPWYQCADLFVLSSRHEGFGNVIVEALEQGVPVVSTDCPSGPREILEDGKYGRLVPVGDAEALAKAMITGLSDQPKSESLKTRAQDFAVDKIADEYLDVLLPKWRDAE